MTRIAILPQPQQMEVGEGHFVLNAGTSIVAPEELAELLVGYLRPATGFELPIMETGMGHENTIELYLTEDDPMDHIFPTSGENVGPPISRQSERYTLIASSVGVVISAPNHQGLFWGIQTLRQLLPPEIHSQKVVSDVMWTVPAVRIFDNARFSWRGLHLDVCRHMYDVASVKKFIDTMALYKFNTFHWHLTEDQGWRIEIKQYPKLTEIGAFRKETPIPSNRKKGDGKPYGGFYTQDEVREIVQYATERHITIVPEIEMPGHAVAVLASYPELGCVGKGYEVRTTWGIAEDVFCAGKEAVFTFLENVLDEVLELFPSEFIHIGGDECPKVRWKKCPDCQARIKAEGLKDEHELQSYFIRRMETWLNNKGRRLIGWDEILEGGLAPNATVMSWRGSKGGIAAAQAGHDVVMTPNTNCYFDYYQGEDTDKEPSAIGGYLPLHHVYAFQPIPEDIDPAMAHHVLGGQGNVWTEYIPTYEQVEYMAYPRAIALAEVVWTYPAERNFEAFRGRLTRHLPHLDALEVNYRQLDKWD